MKRLTRSIICILLCISLLPSVVFASDGSLNNFNKKYTYQSGQFTDVKEGAWFEEYVALAYELGLMNGNSANTFNPSGNTTLSETLTIASRIHKIYSTGNDDFSAIKQEMWNMESDILLWCNGNKNSPAYKEFYSAWYSPYAYYAYNYIDYSIYPIYPFMGADPNGAPFIATFEPISRKTFAYFLAHALPESELTPINDIPDGAIPDVSYDESPEVYMLYRAGVLTGKDDSGKFEPDSYVTRAEVATIISRIVIPSSRKSFALSVPETMPPLANTAGQLGTDTLELKLNLGESETIYIYYYGSGVVTVNYNSAMLRTTWGSWDGHVIPLTIKALQVGYSELQIHPKDNPNSSIYIDVWVEYGGDNNDDTETLNSSLVIEGIGEEFEYWWSATKRNTSKVVDANYKIEKWLDDGNIMITVEVLVELIEVVGGADDIWIGYELFDDRGVCVESFFIFVDASHTHQVYSDTFTIFDLPAGNYILKFKDYTA